MTAYTPEQIAEHRAQWVAALRSGEYEQGRGQLCLGGNAYCCLGVAEHVRRGSDPRAGARYLSQDGMDWLGLRENDNAGRLVDGMPLSYLNDKGMSFAEIADLIETVGLKDGAR